MGDYFSTINKLKREVIELSKDIHKLREEAFEMTIEYGFLKLDPTTPIFVDGEERDEILKARERYMFIENKIQMLQNTYLEKKEEYLLLKEEYRRLHTDEFYKPMDDIDIYNQIGKDGCIIGTKL